MERFQRHINETEPGPFLNDFRFILSLNIFHFLSRVGGHGNTAPFLCPPSTFSGGRAPPCLRLCIILLLAGPVRSKLDLGTSFGHQNLSMRPILSKFGPSWTSFCRQILSRGPVWVAKFGSGTRLATMTVVLKIN